MITLKITFRAVLTLLTSISGRFYKTMGGDIEIGATIQPTVRQRNVNSNVKASLKNECSCPTRKSSAPLKSEYRLHLLMTRPIARPMVDPLTGLLAKKDMRRTAQQRQLVVLKSLPSGIQFPGGFLLVMATVITGGT